MINNRTMKISKITWRMILEVMFMILLFMAGIQIICDYNIIFAWIASFVLFIVSVLSAWQIDKGMFILDLFIW